MELSKTLREVIQCSPSLFPFDFSPDSTELQCVRLSEADYAGASFLDRRLLRSDILKAQIPWPEVQAAAAGLPMRCHFIFHISHVGSTLLSRLLGLHPAIFSLREPALLRKVAKGEYADRLETLLALWSRTFRRGQISVIKATSFVSQHACTLMSQVPQSRAILMYIPLATFLPALLDGAMSDIETEAASRLKRIQRQGLLLDQRVENLSPGERVAMSWLAEMQSLEKISQEFGDRVFWLDFDKFLERQADLLNKAFQHFGMSGDVAEYLSGPVMRRYAKRPEARYDSDVRRRLLERGKQQFAEEIARGHAWLERAGIEIAALPRLHHLV